MIKAKMTVSVRDRKGRFSGGPAVKTALQNARAAVAADIARGFDSGSDPATGKRWPARKGVYAHPMLVRTGALKAAAIAAASGATVRGPVLQVTVATPSYAAFHMAGTKKMAKRKFLGASRATVQALAKALAKAAVGVFSSRGAS